MADDNILLHFSDENKKRQLFLKRIKLSNSPELLKIYNDFFNNNINYFNNKYKNKYIMIGKLQEKEKEGLILKSNKGKNKKYVNNLSKISTSKIISDDSSHGEKKRLGGKFMKDSSLKIGQQYIDDNQIEDLYNKFKIVKKLNKSKTRNFITVKDLIEKKIKINTIKNLKKNEKKYKNELIDNNFQFYKSPDNNEYNKTISTCLSNPNMRVESDFNFIKSFYKNNYKSGYSSYIFKKNINNDKIGLQNFRTLNNFYIEDKNKKNIKKIIKRNKTINKQNQFLLTSKGAICYKNKIEKKILSDLLANQEQTLLKSSKSQTKLENLSNKIAKKLNKQEKDLLILNTDSYRVKKELLNKMEILNQKYGPEHYYNWYNDLRTMTNKNILSKNSLSYIRNPLSNEKSIKMLNKNYSAKNFKKIIKELNKVSHNYKGLIVEGKDLLHLEFDFAKNLKNKKKINNFEAYLPTIDIEDKYFAGETKFQKK